MKHKYLLAILCISLFPYSQCFAQKYEIELGGGRDIHSAPTVDHVNGDRGGFTSALTAGYFLKHFTSGGFMYEEMAWGYNTATGKLKLASPAHSFNLYICQHIRLPNEHEQIHPRYSEFCIKPYIGYALITKGSPYLVPTPGAGYDNNYKGGGFNCGLQIEWLIPVSQNVSAFLNVGTGHAFLNGKNTRTFDGYPNFTFTDNISYGMQYYTGMIGGVYRFFDKGKKKRK